MRAWVSEKRVGIKNQWRCGYILEKSSKRFWQLGVPKQSWESLNEECWKRWETFSHPISATLHLASNKALECWLSCFNFCHLGPNYISSAWNSQTSMAYAEPYFLVSEPMKFCSMYFFWTISFHYKLFFFCHHLSMEENRIYTYVSMCAHTKIYTYLYIYISIHNSWYI